MNIKDERESDIAKQAVLGTLETLNPKDAMEERLVAQLVSLQERAMQFLKQSHSAISIEQQNLYVSMYTKTFRIANETVDMLQRWRRKGSQTVVVQHVSVGDGGKAIVGGNMIAGGG
jgi:NAD-dependent DNA ligase